MKKVCTRLVAVLAFVTCGPAFAQEAPVKSSSSEGLQEITVTGSRIKRPNLASASPMTVVGQDEFKYQGTSSVDTVLNRLPQFTADSNENGSNGNDGTA